MQTHVLLRTPKKHLSYALVCAELERFWSCRWTYGPGDTLSGRYKAIQGHWSRVVVLQLHAAITVTLLLLLASLVDALLRTTAGCSALLLDALLNSDLVPLLHLRVAI